MKKYIIFIMLLFSIPLFGNDNYQAFKYQFLNTKLHDRKMNVSFQLEKEDYAFLIITNVLIGGAMLAVRNTTTLNKNKNYLIFVGGDVILCGTLLISSYKTVYKSK